VSQLVCPWFTQPLRETTNACADWRGVILTSYAAQLSPAGLSFSLPHRRAE